MSDPSDEWLFQVTAGFVVLALAAIHQFNNPSWSRTYTTSARHYGMAMLYAAPRAVVYYMLCATSFPEFVDKHAHGDMAVWSSPILFALGAAWILPALADVESRLQDQLVRANAGDKMPVAVSLAGGIAGRVLRVASGFDGWLRNSLHKRAGVPVIAVRLGAALSSVEFHAPTRLKGEVEALLTHRGFDPDEEWFPEAQKVRSLWYRAALIFHVAREWEKEHRQFGAQTHNELEVLRQRFDQLSLKIARVFDNITRLGSLVERGSVEGGASEDEERDKRDLCKRSIDDILGNAREDVGFFLSQTCLLVARGVLSCRGYRPRRLKMLERLGFSVPPSLERSIVPPVNVYLYSFVVVLAAVTMSFAVLGAGSSDKREITIRLIMIGVIQVTAIAIATIPKRLWGFANAGITGRTPIGFVVGAGAMSLAMFVAISLMFRMCMFGEWARAWRDFLIAGRPWGVVAVATAVLTAFLVQDHRWASLKSQAVQWLDAGFMGVGEGVAMYVTMRSAWLMGASRFPVQPGDSLWRAWVLLGIGALIGVGIGVVVPTSVRDTRYAVEALRGRRALEPTSKEKWVLSMRA